MYGLKVDPISGDDARPLFYYVHSTEFHRMSKRFMVSHYYFLITRVDKRFVTDKFQKKIRALFCVLVSFDTFPHRLSTIFITL